MMDQELINKNLTNAMTAHSKLILNLLERQQYMFGQFQDGKMQDLCQLDIQILQQLQDILERMKKFL